jgi:hypothetical protein
MVLRGQGAYCHYRHKLAGPPIISWPKLAGFSGARQLLLGHFKDKLAASSVFQAKCGRGCGIAHRRTYHFDSHLDGSFQIECMYEILRTCDDRKHKFRFAIGSKRLFGACGRLRRVRSRSERPGASEKTVQHALQERGTLAMSCADAEAPGDSRYTCPTIWHRRFSRPLRMAVIYRS